MNEIRELVGEFDAANERGERCALATIVSVEGSAYRRPGARMLICENGSNTGTISAGCLENDAIAHAEQVLRTGRAKLVEYDNASTTDEIAWGLGLGCNGTVRVLVEPLSSNSPYISALRRTCELPVDTAPISVATVYACSPDRSGAPVGARVIVDEEGNVSRENVSDDAAAILETELRRGVTNGAISCDINGAAAQVFIETLLPPVPLVIFGAGQDALPIVKLAREMGWQVEVVDPQARQASLSRFDTAHKVTLLRPEDIRGKVSITPRTLTLVMSHNYTHDLEFLRFVLASPARYIGVMGPRKRTARMLSELSAAREFREDVLTLDRIYSPVGLDIAANSPVEIAVSIVAEMRAVLNGRFGGMLRENRDSIHGRAGDGDPVSVQKEQTAIAS